jgi:hypothetical protein
VPFGTEEGFLAVVFVGVVVVSAAAAAIVLLFSILTWGII